MNVYKVQGTAISILKNDKEEEIRGGTEDVAINVLAADEYAAGDYATGYISLTKDKRLISHSILLVATDVLDSNISLLSESIEPAPKKQGGATGPFPPLPKAATPPSTPKSVDHDEA